MQAHGSGPPARTAYVPLVHGFDDHCGRSREVLALAPKFSSDLSKVMTGIYPATGIACKHETDAGGGGGGRGGGRHVEAGRLGRRWTGEREEEGECRSAEDVTLFD